MLQRGRGCWLGMMGLGREVGLGLLINCVWDIGESTLDITHMCRQDMKSGFIIDVGVLRLNVSIDPIQDFSQQLARQSC
jgi:hypothetical protein